MYKPIQPLQGKKRLPIISLPKRKKKQKRQEPKLSKLLPHLQSVIKEELCNEIWPHLAPPPIPPSQLTNKKGKGETEYEEGEEDIVIVDKKTGQESWLCSRIRKQRKKKKTVIVEDYYSHPIWLKWKRCMQGKNGPYFFWNELDSQNKQLLQSWWECNEK